MANLHKKVQQAKVDSGLRAIEVEAKRRSLADDGKTSPAERYAIRAELRAAAGMPSERVKAGGFKKWAPAAAVLAAPFALSALGALGAGGAGTAAGTAGAAGAAGTAAASPFSLASLGAKLGGVADTVGKVASNPTTKLALTALQGLNAANQRRKADRTMQAQLDRENALFSAAAPLRVAGTTGMLNPATPDLSRLRAAQDRASNFADLAAPMPMGGRF